MSDPAAFLSSTLAILAMWFAFDTGYRAYRQSLFRDRLFELRSDLFEVARAGLFGERGFSDPVYCHMRRVLNGSIRFTHQMTLSRLLILLWSSRWWLDHDLVDRRNAEFGRALADHKPEARERVKHIMRELDFAIVMHVVHINIVGFVLMSALDVAARCLHAQQAARSAIARKIVRNRKMLEPLEQDALCGLERLEHRLAAS